MKSKTKQKTQEQQPAAVKPNPENGGILGKTQIKTECNDLQTS